MMKETERASVRLAEIQGSVHIHQDIHHNEYPDRVQGQVEVQVGSIRRPRNPRKAKQHKHNPPRNESALTDHPSKVGQGARCSRSL